MKQVTSFIGLCAPMLMIALFTACPNPVSDVVTKETPEPAKSYVITYNPNGGSGTMANQTIVSGASAPLIANAYTRTGFAFSGWATSAEATTVVYADGASYAMGTADVNLYAVWAAIPPGSFSITFNANGGIGTMSNQTIVSGASATLAANAFTREGYTFAGWAGNEKATRASYVDGANYTIESANVTLFAVWIANALTITFDPNGGSGTMDMQQIKCGSSAWLTINTFTREHYSFVGWSTRSNAKTAEYRDKARYTMGTKDVTLFAIWMETEYTVTFSSNNGTGIIRLQYIRYNMTEKLDVNPFSRAGYVFLGWSGTADATSPEYTDGAYYTMNTANPTLYAVWISGRDILSRLESGGYTAMITVPAVMDDSYTQEEGYELFNFVHNISGFDLGKYEVTYELWYEVFKWGKSNGYNIIHQGREGDDGVIGGNLSTAKYEPVSDITWRDCIVWCNAYSEMSGKTPVYYSDSAFTTPIRRSVDAHPIDAALGSCDNPYVNWRSNGYRLPTEGEWQYAASCHATYHKDFVSGSDAPFAVTSDASDIDGDGDIQYTDDVAWIKSNSSGSIHPVGLKAQNKWGFFDMGGNVAELCFDWSNIKPTTKQQDYYGADAADERIVKGGSYNFDVPQAYLCYPWGAAPDCEWWYIGFRVCCSR